MLIYKYPVVWVQRYIFSFKPPNFYATLFDDDGLRIGGLPIGNPHDIGPRLNAKTTDSTTDVAAAGFEPAHAGAAYGIDLTSQEGTGRQAVNANRGIVGDAEHTRLGSHSPCIPIKTGRQLRKVR